MSENQNNLEVSVKETSTTTNQSNERSTSQANKAQVAFSPIKHVLLINLVISTFSLSSILFTQLVIWIVKSTVGIDEDSTYIISTAIFRSSIVGYAMQTLFCRNAHSYLKILAKHLPYDLTNLPKRKIKQAICLGIVISFIAIGLIAIKDGAVLRLIGAAFLLTISIISFGIGFGFAKLSSYIFKRNFKALLDSASK